MCKEIPLHKMLHVQTHWNEKTRSVYRQRQCKLCKRKYTTYEFESEPVRGMRMWYNYLPSAIEILRKIRRIVINSNQTKEEIINEILELLEIKV